MELLKRQTDEIDLLEFIRFVWKRKLLVLFPILISISVGCGVMKFSKRVYEARAFLLPPFSSDLSYLNTNLSSKSKSTTYFFKNFIAELGSEDTRLLFFNQEKLLEANNKSDFSIVDFDKIKQLNSMITLKKMDCYDCEKYQLVFRTSDKERLPILIKQFINAANAASVKEVVSQINQTIMQEKHKLTKRIEQKAILAEQDRLDKLIGLREALYIAKSLGIKKPGTLSRNEPYLMGSTAIQLKIDALKKSTGNSYYFSKLRELQIEHDNKKAIDLSSDTLKFYTLSGPIILSENPVAPNKKIILTISLVFGTMAGLIITLFFFLKDS